MKKVFLTIKSVVIASAILAVSSQAVEAQTQREIAKERKVLSKMSKSELNSRAGKTARKEAKKLTKQGWVVAPGVLPLEKQLDRAYQMQYEYDENLFPKYIMGDAISIGENYDAAKMQALELSKQNLAGQIQTEITTLIENSVANQQMTKEQAVSIVESVTASKNLILQSIGRVIPVVETYRINNRTKNREVSLRIAYNSDMAKEAAKKAIRQDLEEKGNKLHEQLDQVLGF